MIQKLERLIEVIKTWPASRQNDAAAVLEALTEQDGNECYVLSAQEREAIDASRAQASRGEFVTDSDVAAVLRKHGL